MQAEPAAAPTLDGNRPVTRLVLPTVDGALHDHSTLLGALLAERWGVPIDLVHVTSSIASADESLAHLAELLHDHHPAVEIRPVHLYGDDPAVAIAGHVGPGDLVIMATENIDAWRVKGSTAEALLDRVGGPVLLIGPNVTLQHLRERGIEGEVIVGVDGSAAAEAGVPTALAFAASLDHGMWLIRVTAEPEPGDPLHPEMGRALQRLAEACDSKSFTRWEIVHGNDTARTLEAVADRHDAAFLVVSRRPRSSPDRRSMASVAAGLVALAHRPVLVLTAPPVAAVGPG